MSVNYFIFDKNRCVGCEACVVACINENGFQSNGTWRNIFSQNQAKLPGIPLFHVSLACNHCEDAPCMKNCPALAYHRSDISHSVLHMADACIGCQYCVWQCPYEAPKFNPSTGIVEKCNFCETRQSENKAPACASLCPTDALSFSSDEIDKSNIPMSIDVAENPLPSLKVQELEKKTGPEMDMSLFEGSSFIKPTNTTQDHRINAKHEWPLLVFTFMVSVLVAISVYLAEQDPPSWLKWTMAIAAGTGALLSSLHLGKKLRMWRAVLNLKQSWLSREIFFFGMYYLLMLIDFFFYNIHYYLILVPAILTLLSIDMLYKPVQHHWKLAFHSGQSIFTTLSITLLLFQLYWLLLAVLLIRMFIDVYGFGKLDDQLFKDKLFIARWATIDIAIILLLLGAPFPFILGMILIGEFLDRIKFYNELRIQKVSL
jgi:Fe-S-cluster-containing dehydrogenase component/DMSO reductase anchor subunit